MDYDFFGNTFFECRIDSFVDHATVEDINIQNFHNAILQSHREVSYIALIFTNHCNSVIQ